MPQRTLLIGLVRRCLPRSPLLILPSVTHGEAKEGEIEAVGYGCDVSSEDSVRETFAKIKERFGRVDVSPLMLG